MNHAKEWLNSMNMDERTAFIRDYGTQAWEALNRDAAKEAPGGDGQEGLPSGPFKRSEMSTGEKVDYINKHGIEAFQALPMN